MSDPHPEPEGIGADIRDMRVRRAVAEVPRHEFVPEESRAEAYGDFPLPIGFGQTISQPYIVALMTQALEPRPGSRVLEVGTGSGYQAAVLARLVGHVYTVEIIPELALRAERDFRRLGISNVSVRIGDGGRGWPEHAPYDGIVVTCAAPLIPRAWLEQLAEGGRLVVPVGAPRDPQRLELWQRQGDAFGSRLLAHVRFVPMTGRVSACG